MKEKLVALKDKVLDFVDSVKASPAKQAVALVAVGVVIGVALCKLA